MERQSSQWFASAWGQVIWDQQKPGAQVIENIHETSKSLRTESARWPTLCCEN
jgi:hypothetical protein